MVAFLDYRLFKSLLRGCWKLYSFFCISSAPVTVIPYECRERDCPGTIKGLLGQQLERVCSAVAGGEALGSLSSRKEPRVIIKIQFVFPPRKIKGMCQA